MAIKIGEAKFSSKKTYFKIKDGSQTFRILPPIGDLADDGVWSKYYRINYGYVNGENKSRPFESSLVKNQKTKMVEVPDAAVERFDLLKARYEEAHKAGDTKTKEVLLPLVGGPKSRYNVDSNHYMNAIDLQGNIGILKLRHKCKQQLDMCIRELREKGINPLSIDNGRFFTITRTGTRNETAFAVKVYKKEETIQGVGLVERDVVHALDESIIKRLEREAGELDKLFKKPSAAQIAQIVAESDLRTGVSPNIDKILDNAEGGNSGENDSSGDDEETTTTTTASADPVAQALAAQPAAAAAPTPAPTQTAAPVAPAPAVTATPAPVQAQAAPTAPTATAVETPTPVAPAPTVPQTTAQKVNEMSEKDFLASLGIN